MRKVPALVGTVVALASWLASSSWSQAQQGGEKEKEPITIQGVVAEITAEGEVIFDYAHNKAVEAEAAFLTVVGAPKTSQSGGGERATKVSSDKSGQTDGKHDNIYIVWLTPKTKVCKCTVDNSGVQRASTSSSPRSEKKECSLDNLEVGEMVEIQFIPRSENNERQVGHQTEKMRQTHGRDRTYVGYAAEVTILEPTSSSPSGSQDRGR